MQQMLPPTKGPAGAAQGAITAIRAENLQAPGGDKEKKEMEASDGRVGSSGFTANDRVVFDSPQRRCQHDIWAGAVVDVGGEVGLEGSGSVAVAAACKDTSGAYAMDQDWGLVQRQSRRQGGR